MCYFSRKTLKRDNYENELASIIPQTQSQIQKYQIRNNNETGENVMAEYPMHTR